MVDLLLLQISRRSSISSVVIMKDEQKWNPTLFIIIFSLCYLLDRTCLLLCLVSFVKFFVCVIWEKASIFHSKNHIESLKRYDLFIQKKKEKVSAIVLQLTPFQKHFSVSVRRVRKNDKNVHSRLNSILLLVNQVRRRKIKKTPFVT